jgi:hypothetical protein
MPCYSMRGGHIASVEELPGLTDDEALAKAHALISERKELFRALSCGTGRDF